MGSEHIYENVQGGLRLLPLSQCMVDFNQRMRRHKTLCTIDSEDAFNSYLSLYGEQKTSNPWQYYRDLSFNLQSAMTVSYYRTFVITLSIVSTYRVSPKSNFFSRERPRRQKLRKRDEYCTDSHLFLPSTSLLSACKYESVYHPQILNSSPHPSSFFLEQIFPVRGSARYADSIFMHTWKPRTHWYLR